MKKRTFKFSFNVALFLIWLLLFAFISIKAPNFLKPNYLISVMLRNIIEIGMVALPMTLVIITAGIDLSVGNILVLSCMLGGMAAGAAGDAVGALITLAVGLICGIINGIIIAKVKITPMVTTLATMYLYLGLARGITQGDSVYAFPLAALPGKYGDRRTSHSDLDLPGSGCGYLSISFQKPHWEGKSTASD